MKFSFRLNLAYLYYLIPFTLLPSWYILWGPLASLNTRDEYAIIDAQRYYQGYTRFVFDLNEPLSSYCYSWNDCFHNYIYSFFHSAFGSAVWLNVVLYLVLVSNILCFARNSNILLGLSQLSNKILFFIPLLINPFIFIYSCMPSKELLSTVLVSSILRFALWTRRYFFISGIFKNPKLFFKFIVNLLFFVGLLVFSALYRFQLLPISILILLAFPFRSILFASYLRYVRPNYFLLLVSLGILSYFIATKYGYLSSFSLLNNLPFVFAPFNFPFPFNPGFLSLYQNPIFDPILLVGAMTQLSGFLISVTFLITIVKKLLSTSSFLLLALASSVGFLYGPTSTRYVMTIGYFLLLSLLLDLFSRHVPMPSKSALEP